MKHDYIINIRAAGRGFYDKFDGSKPEEILFIIMDFASEGEIFDIISNTGAFSEETARYYFIQIIAALNYMHNTAGICHRDLKPENILMDANFNIKIADFGFAIPLEGHNGNGKLQSYKGTLGYMPPEQHARKSYSGKSADLFAASVVLFMMVT
jgi:serine/threonine protein kinase